MHYLYTDGGARGNPGPAASAAFLFDENFQLISFDAKYMGNTTNNIAEYTGLIIGLELAASFQITELECRLDSELVVKQLKGEYKVKEQNMQILHGKVQTLLMGMSKVEFVHVPRAQNKFADRLVNLTMDTAANKS
jgi:ribonuclease HI